MDRRKKPRKDIQKIKPKTVQNNSQRGKVTKKRKQRNGNKETDPDFVLPNKIAANNRQGKGYKF